MEPTATPSTPRSSRRTSAVLAIASCVLGGAAQASAQQPPAQGNIVITSGASQRLAVPECVPRAGDDASRSLCRTVTEVLRADLDFEGLFKFVPDSLMAALRMARELADNTERTAG